MREGTRVASIETGLAAAAAKLSQQVRRGPARPGWELSQAWGHPSIADPWEWEAGEVGAGSTSPGGSEPGGGACPLQLSACATSPHAGGVLVPARAPALLWGSW